MADMNEELIKLMNRRSELPWNDPEQERMAPREHQLFARQMVNDNLWNLPLLMAAIPGYQAMKVSGLKPQATPASFDQLASSYRGMWEGLGDRVQGGLENIKNWFYEPDPADVWTTPEMNSLQQLQERMGQSPRIYNDGLMGQNGEPSLFQLGFDKRYPVRPMPNYGQEAAPAFNTQDNNAYGVPGSWRGDFQTPGMRRNQPFLMNMSNEVPYMPPPPPPPPEPRRGEPPQQVPPMTKPNTLDKPSYEFLDSPYQREPHREYPKLPNRVRL